MPVLLSEAKPYIDLTEAAIANMRELIKLLETVDDKAGATAAAPEAERLFRRHLALIQRATELPKPSQDILDQLSPRYDKTVDSLINALHRLEQKFEQVNYYGSDELEDAMCYMDYVPLDESKSRGSSNERTSP